MLQQLLFNYTNGSLSVETEFSHAEMFDEGRRLIRVEQFVNLARNTLFVTSGMIEPLAFLRTELRHARYTEDVWDADVATDARHFMGLMIHFDDLSILQVLSSESRSVATRSVMTDRMRHAMTAKMISSVKAQYDVR